MKPFDAIVIALLCGCAADCSVKAFAEALEAGVLNDLVFFPAGCIL